MAFTKNQTYVARRSFITFESDDDIPIQIDKGCEYTASGPHLVDVVTGEVTTVTNHIARRPEWYFDKKGEFNPSRTSPSQKEYVSEIVTASDGFDLDALYAIIEDENWGPLEKPLTKNNLSRVLTEVCTSQKFGMMKDGEWVVGIGHNKKGCTFHKRSKKVA